MLKYETIKVIIIILTMSWTQVLYSLAIFAVHSLNYLSIPINCSSRKFSMNGYNICS